MVAIQEEEEEVVHLRGFLRYQFACYGATAGTDCKYEILRSESSANEADGALLVSSIQRRVCCLQVYMLVLVCRYTIS